MKRPKLCKKNENSCNKIQFFGFLLINILDEIFKISTIVENLVTLPDPTLQYHNAQTESDVLLGLAETIVKKIFTIGIIDQLNPGRPATICIQKDDTLN